MIIGIEAERANNPVKTGVEHYAKQLILHLASLDHENTYRLYLRTQPEPWFKELPDNFEIKVMPFPIFWTQLRISLEMLIRPPDVLFIPASALPIIHPKNSVVTIHDIAWKFYPEAETAFNKKFLPLSTWYAVKFAKHVIAVSQATKNDLVEHYKISPDKIKVVHHGYEKLPAQDFSDEIKRKYESLKPYLLFLSTIQPRKNLIRLIEAFDLFKKENPQLPHQLVVVGRPGWNFEPSLEAIEKHKDKVTYLNYVSDADRLYLLQNATALATPSLYEGFGMQVLEAFTAQTPVLSANISSLPEVAGKAALYFDPYNINEIKEVLNKITQDENLRQELIKKGNERLKDFSWTKCASQTHQVFMETHKK